MSLIKVGIMATSPRIRIIGNTHIPLFRKLYNSTPNKYFRDAEHRRVLILTAPCTQALLLAQALERAGCSPWIIMQVPYMETNHLQPTINIDYCPLAESTK